MDIFEIDNIMASVFEREVYRVGGSVRDELIGRPSKDADYVVREQPLSDIIGLLAGAGASVSPLKLRTGHIIGVRANFRGLGTAEVAMPRKEVSTGPGRHDFDIVIDPSITLAEDCCRRDFTFNALYKRVAGDPRTLIFNERGESIYNIEDPTGRGLYDLEHRIIATTHPDSFRDDPLRMLRALRFVSCLGFDLGATATVEMQQHGATITGLNADGNMSGTVWDEIQKMLMGERPHVAARQGTHLGVLNKLFHGLMFDGFRPLETAAKLGAPLHVRLALLFREGGWEAAGAMTNMPKEVKSAVTKLLNNPVPLRGGGIPKRARFMRVEFGDELAKDMILTAACIAAHGKNKQNALGLLGSLEKAREVAQEQRVPKSIKELQIDGRDLIDLRFSGQEIGAMLRAVLVAVNRDPTPTNLTREGQFGLLAVAADG